MDAVKHALDRASPESARAAGIDPRTLRNWRRWGRLPTRGTRRAAEKLAKAAGVPLAPLLGGAPEPAPVAPVAPEPEADEVDAAAATAGSLTEEERRERIRLTRSRAEDQERRNAVALGELAPVAEFDHRVGRAATELRNGRDAVRRRVEAVCCEGCRAAVVEAVGKGMDEVRSRVGEALNGGG